MRIDYHTHHERCGHAVGKLEEYVQRGVEIGLSQIGLSDHMPLLHVDPAQYYPEMAMPMDELPRYVEECFSLKERYRGQIDVRVGLEGDYIEGWETEIRAIIERYPWDYVIGSVHFLGEWDITDFRQTHHWEGKDILEVYRQYYDAVRQPPRACTILWAIRMSLNASVLFLQQSKQKNVSHWRTQRCRLLPKVAAPWN